MIHFDKLVEISRALYDPNHPLRAFHVSFLLRRNKILAIGINKKCTHTLNLRNRKHNRAGQDISNVKYQCSEFSLLRKSRSQNINYNKCDLVNVRINKSGNLDIARPCSSCQSLLRHFRVSDVYYTDKNGNFQKF